MKQHVRSYEGVVAEIGAARRGIVTAASLRVRGVPPHVPVSLRAQGLLVGVGRGVDRLRDHPFDYDSRCQAALDLAGPDAVLGLRTAGRRHSLWSYRSTDVIEVLIPRGTDHRNGVGRVIQTRLLPAAHVTWIDGFPVTTIARTFFDLCGEPDRGLRVSHPAHERAMARVYNDAVARRGLTFHAELATLAVLARRGRAGSSLVRMLLRRFGVDYVPTQSEVESLFAELVDAHGLPEPERQVPISDERGFIGVVDFLWRRCHLVVEIDSSWHDGPLDRSVDAERDARLTAAGYRVLRFRYGDLVATPSAVIRQLEAVMDVSRSQLPPVRG